MKITVKSDHQKREENFRANFLLEFGEIGEENIFRGIVKREERVVIFLNHVCRGHDIKPTSLQILESECSREGMRGERERRG